MTIVDEAFMEELASEVTEGLSEVFLAHTRWMRKLLIQRETELAVVKAERDALIGDVMKADLRAEEYRRRAFAMLKRVRQLKRG